MVQFQVNAPNGVPNEVLKRSCRNTDLAKTPEQLWFSTLMYFASVLRVQQVSCLHDKICAFFGIAKRSMPLSLISTEVFDVDYGQTVDDVFISFSSMLLRNLPTLSPLSTSEGVGLGRRKREELPSWSPDYSIRNSMNLNNRREQIQYGIPGFAASLVDGDGSTPLSDRWTNLSCHGEEDS